MFYYYGAKNILSKYYPAPSHDLIIEPFAGSGAYSCRHLLQNSNLRSILCDKNDDVAEAWDFILHCSENDIINFKKPKIGDYAHDFLIKTCSVSNASSKCKKMKYSKRIDKVFEAQKRRMLKFLPIRSRISFLHCDYKELDNELATWFVDPPYQVIDNNTKTVFKNGNGYSYGCDSNSINYAKLSRYCLDRNGQVIVCEKSGADWLPFEGFAENKTSLNKKYREVLYYRENNEVQEQNDFLGEHVLTTGDD